MRAIALILSFAVLAACDPSYKPRPEPEASTGGSGVTFSGYGRIGASGVN